MDKDRYVSSDRFSSRCCWVCEHWSGVAICQGSHACCGHPRHPGLIGRPRLGCAFFARAVGLDELDAETCDALAHKYSKS